jgi:hypothetical protein
VRSVHPAAVGTTIDEPQPGETVQTPFEAYGSVVTPGGLVTAYAISDTTGKRYDGTPVPPPADDNWAFRFDVDVPDDYAVYVSIGGWVEGIDPVHVH